MKTSTISRTYVAAAEHTFASSSFLWKIVSAQTTIHSNVVSLHKLSHLKAGPRPTTASHSDQRSHRFNPTSESISRIVCKYHASNTLLLWLVSGLVSNTMDPLRDCYSFDFREPSPRTPRGILNWIFEVVFTNRSVSLCLLPPRVARTKTKQTAICMQAVTHWDTRSGTQARLRWAIYEVPRAHATARSVPMG